MMSDDLCIFLFAQGFFMFFLFSFRRFGVFFPDVLLCCHFRPDFFTRMGCIQKERDEQFEELVLF